MEIISSNKPKARKEHKCNWCGCIIPVGEVYDRQFLKYDYVYVWKSHTRCLKIASKLDMFDNCDDGITEDDFREIIQDTYHNMEFDMSDDNNDVDLGASTFKEMLDTVCEKYLKPQKA